MARRLGPLEEIKGRRLSLMSHFSNMMQGIHMTHAQMKSIFSATIRTARRTARGSGSLQICALSLQQATKSPDTLFHIYRSYLVSSPFREEKEKKHMHLLVSCCLHSKIPFIIFMLISSISNSKITNDPHKVRSLFR